MARTVLLVDDDAQLLRVVSMFLDIENFNVITASDGREAMDKLNEYHPDLVIMDLMMPGVSGLELCQHIRASEKLKDIPVVVFTASELDEAALREAGANAFLTKPYSLDGLRDVVGGLLDKEESSAR